jgi:hypothetical protein
MKKVCLNNYFFCFIIIFLCSNIFSKLLPIAGFNRYTAIVNFIFELFLLFMLFFKRVCNRTLSYFFVLCATFFIGQYFSEQKSFNVSSLKAVANEILSGHLLQLNNYVYIYIYYSVYKYVKNKEDIALKIFDVLLVFFLHQFCICIVRVSYGF